MGADQSSANSSSEPFVPKSQRDDDIPYTSYSINKPIDGDATDDRAPHPRSAPSAPAADPRPAAQGHSIVVVAEGSSRRLETDTELDRLDQVPTFLPLIRASLSGGGRTEGAAADGLERLDARCLLALCLRYQDHLRQCAEAVAFDQNALCIRIKEIDFAIQTLYAQLTERQRKFARCAEHIRKVNDISSALARVKASVDQTIPLMERLNSVLPPGDQLEPFSMKPS